MSKETGGPAYPSKKRIYRAGYATGEFEPVEGMTLRQYAAIKLKVPDSGEDWLDDMIRASLRDDFVLSAGVDDARYAYYCADKMLEARK